MKIFKNDVTKLLNSFEWDFKEIFFEKSKSFKIVCVNGVFKTPSFWENEWFSVLSRIWKKEYFKVFSWLFDEKQKIDLFKSDFWLSSDDKKIMLIWNEYLTFKELEKKDFCLEKIVQATNDLFKKYFKDNIYIKSSEIFINLSNKSFIVWNSTWNFKSDNQFYNTYFIKLLWEKDWNTEEIYEKITWVDIIWSFNYENIEKSFLKVLDILDKQLNGIPSPSWIMDVIIWNESGWTIIHEAVWHGLEADLLYSSIYKDKIWQKVAHESVSVADNPTLQNQRWFYEFDHEWNKAQNTILIENWILKSYMHNEKTAQKFDTKSTSHGRKETYKHKTLVRMWTTYLMPWTDKKEDLIKKVKSWIYVSRMWGWQVNTTTWDFVFKVQNWYLIENWELKNNIKWATLIWNWPQMLNDIYGICDDLDFLDWGTCWKWQSMPVSDWTPTILTKLKVSWVV